MVTVEKAKAVKEEMARLSKAIDAWLRLPESQRMWGRNESGAVFRASMDLTRALANLRKSGQ